jgi:hypothetical protein
VNPEITVMVMLGGPQGAAQMYSQVQSVLRSEHGFVEFVARGGETVTSSGLPYQITIAAPKPHLIA